MIEEMVNKTSPEKLQLLTLMRQHPQLFEEVLREMVSKFHDPLAWLRPYVGELHGGVTLDLQNVDRLVFFHEDSKDSTDGSRLMEVWEEFRKFRRACRDTRPVRRGWIVEVMRVDANKIHWELMIDFKRGLDRLRGAIWRLRKTDGFIAADYLCGGADNEDDNDSDEEAYESPAYSDASSDSEA
jgi:hypothetical protein